MFYVLPAGLFIVALAGRSVATVGFLERPLVLGLVWFFITGEAVPALPFAVFFELLWLDAQPIGSFLPPMPSFSYLLFLAFAENIESAHAALYLPPLAIVLPTAYIIPYLEQKHRNSMSKYSALLLEKAAENLPLGRIPGELVLKSAAWTALWGVSAFLVLLCLGKPLAEYGGPLLGGSVFPALHGYVFYTAGAVGALLALRMVRACMVFIFSMAVLILVGAA